MVVYSEGPFLAGAGAPLSSKQFGNILNPYQCRECFAGRFVKRALPNSNVIAAIHHVPEGSLVTRAGGDLVRDWLVPLPPRALYGSLVHFHIFIRRGYLRRRNKTT